MKTGSLHCRFCESQKPVPGFPVETHPCELLLVSEVIIALGSLLGHLFQGILQIFRTLFSS